MRLSIYTDANLKSYFRGVRYLQEEGKISRIEVTGLRQLMERPHKILRMIGYMKADKLIVFMAPYNPLAYYFLFLKKVMKHNSIVYLSSWPYWGEEGKYRWKPYTPFIRTVWKRFVNDIKAVALTERARKGLEERRARAYHIPHSVDTNVFQPQKGERKGAIKILYVGRMIPQKGIRYLLSIAREMSTQDVEFWFVGEGPLIEEIQKAQQNCKIKYFEYIDKIETLAGIYSEADIFVLPSYATDKWEELFGIVLIEAMSCGLPVIATDCIGPQEIIEHGENGYIVPQRDKQALKEKLQILIDDKELRIKMGGLGRKLAEEKYDVKKVSEMWWKVLSEENA
jgi:glycosyltransferase involved in cell wall biosynthesis